ncbi:MAG TPA: hypothetical protein VM347_09940 [Nonomuraea sp.]|nr:hypothetical protein [Nonomuraea sp.]
MDPTFATKGELAIRLLTDAYTDGIGFDFIIGAPSSPWPWAAPA